MKGSTDGQVAHTKAGIPETTVVKERDGKNGPAVVSGSVRTVRNRVAAGGAQDSKNRVPTKYSGSKRPRAKKDLRQVESGTGNPGRFEQVTGLPLIAWLSILFLLSGLYGYSAPAAIGAAIGLVTGVIVRG